MGIVGDVLALTDLWRNDDHTRRCPAREGAGACICGYDDRLDRAITAVINGGAGALVERCALIAESYEPQHESNTALSRQIATNIANEIRRRA